MHIRSSKARPGDPEHDLIIAVDDLRNQASAALESSASILANHEKFATQMDALLSSSINHATGDLYRPTELMAIGDNILDQSSEISMHTKAMQDQLEYILKLVNEVKKRQERRLLWKKILKWLVKAFNILALILSAGALIMPLVVPGIGAVGSAALGAGAVLATAAAVVCQDMARGVSSIPQSLFHANVRAETDAERNFDKMVNFLHETVPKQAHRAQRALSTFQECHRVLQLDVQMKNGKCLRMSQYDAERARNEWRTHRNHLAMVNENLRGRQNAVAEASRT